MKTHHQLGLDSNQLTSIPKTFKNLTKLKCLNLGMNDLGNSSFDKSIWSGLTHLVTLSIFGNRLTDLPENLTACIRLESIYAGYNNILGLSSNTYP